MNRMMGQYQIRVATLFHLVSGAMLTLLVLLRRVMYLTMQSSLATNHAERCIRHRLCARAVAPRHHRGRAPLSGKGVSAREPEAQDVVLHSSS